MKESTKPQSNNSLNCPFGKHLLRIYSALDPAGCSGYREKLDGLYLQGLAQGLAETDP